MIAHKKVLLLIGPGQTPRYLYHAIKEEINITAVGMEERPSRLQLLRGRIKRLGYGKVLGQLLFMLLVPRVLTTMSRERIKSLHALYGFNQDPIPEDLLHSFTSVNSNACYNFLVEQQPPQKTLKISDKQPFFSAARYSSQARRAIRLAIRALHQKPLKKRHNKKQYPPKKH